MPVVPRREHDPVDRRTGRPAAGCPACPDGRGRSPRRTRPGRAPGTSSRAAWSSRATPPTVATGARVVLLGRRADDHLARRARDDVHRLAVHPAPAGSGRADSRPRTRTISPRTPRTSRPNGVGQPRARGEDRDVAGSRGSRTTGVRASSAASTARGSTLWSSRSQAPPATRGPSIGSQTAKLGADRARGPRPPGPRSSAHWRSTCCRSP